MSALVNDWWIEADEFAPLLQPRWVEATDQCFNHHYQGLDRHATRPWLVVSYIFSSQHNLLHSGASIDKAVMDILFFLLWLRWLRPTAMSKDGVVCSDPQRSLCNFIFARVLCFLKSSLRATCVVLCRGLTNEWHMLTPKRSKRSFHEFFLANLVSTCTNFSKWSILVVPSQKESI